jgi:hypothetical protein
MEPLDQLQTEWVFINASRELLSIMTGIPGVRYSESIRFAKTINSKLFEDSKTGIDKKDYLENELEKYKQEAIAKSLREKKNFTAESLIRNRANEIKRLLKQHRRNDNRFNLLKKELRELVMIENQASFSQLGLESLTENQAINSDSSGKRIGKIFINNHLGKFYDYHSLDNNSVFRVSVLHPNPAEGIIGADLIYEQYDESTKKVRIVAIQYKIWENQVLYFNKSGNIQAQIAKMKKCFCGNNYCLDANGKKYSSRAYRLSYCMAFLKPTDKLQDPKKPVTTGYHIPVCKIEGLKEKANKHFKLTAKAIKKQSLKTSAFEELFEAEMLGSRWLRISQLEKFYKKNKVLDPKEKIILYAQGTKRNENER